MIRRISFGMFTIMLIMAFYLFMIGVHQVPFDNSYYTFMKNLDNSYSTWQVSIPDIPTIPDLSDYIFADISGGIIDVLKAFVNMIVGLLNAVVFSFNMMINMLNILIHVIQFVITFAWCISNFVNSFA